MQVEYIIYKYILTICVDNVAMRERIVQVTDDKEEMTIYERDKTYYSECHDSFSKWYNRNTASNSKNRVR